MPRKRLLAAKTPRPARCFAADRTPSKLFRHAFLIVLEQQYGQASRRISTGRLNTLPCVDLQPINQVVFLAPSGGLNPQGWLILGRASRLDAFSGYPFRT